MILTVYEVETDNSLTDTGIASSSAGWPAVVELATAAEYTFTGNPVCILSDGSGTTWAVGDTVTINGAPYTVSDTDGRGNTRAAGCVNFTAYPAIWPADMTLLVTPDVTTADPSPKFILTWANERGLFGQEHELSLGSTGDRNPTVRLHRLGMYRTRQWKLVCTDNAPFIITSFEEEVTPLSN